MGGRYVSPASASIDRQWQVLRSPGEPFPERFNVAPGADVPFLYFQKSQLKFGSAKWGLVPHWWKDAKPPRLSHNARIEEAAGKPMWRDAMRGARGLMPARGWY